MIVTFKDLNGSFTIREISYEQKAVAVYKNRILIWKKFEKINAVLNPLTDKEIEFQAYIGVNYIPEVIETVKMSKGEVRKDCFGLGASTRYIIVKEDENFKFVFQNNDNLCTSHAELADYYDFCGGEGYAVSGGFYSHNFELFSEDNLKITISIFGASSTYRKPTKEELDSAIENFSHWRKEYIKFVVI